jgi:serine/threonine-protein kinase
MTSAIGKYIQNGKYTLEQELGQGGFGVTYLARHNTLGHAVVIKTLNDSLRQDPKFWEFHHQFQEEAKRLARFSHPNIVRVTDFFIEESLPYIVMDFIPGQTLNTLVIPNHPLPESVAIHYIRQVANALKVVHQNGLLHRDVKPQNIILRQGTQDVVLIDFGIAREFVPGLTKTHTGVLSMGYAPIEQYLPRTKRTPATDVYGLAATLYTLLTAEVPVAATLRHRQPLPEPRELRLDISPMVNQAVLHGMALEPEQRPATVDDWLALLPSASDGAFKAGAALYPSTTTEPTLAVAPPPPSNFNNEPIIRYHENQYRENQYRKNVPNPSPGYASPDETAWSNSPGRGSQPMSGSGSGSQPPKFNDRPWLIAGFAMLGALGAIILGNLLLRTTQFSPESPAPTPTPASPTPAAPESPTFEAPPPIETQPTPATPSPEVSPSPEAEDSEVSPSPEATDAPTLEEEQPDEAIESPPAIESPEPLEPPASPPQDPDPQSTVDSGFIPSLALPSPVPEAPIQTPPSQVSPAQAAPQNSPEEISDRGRGRDRALGQNRDDRRERGSKKDKN